MRKSYVSEQAYLPLRLPDSGCVCKIGSKGLLRSLFRQFSYNGSKVHQPSDELNPKLIMNKELARVLAEEIGDGMAVIVAGDEGANFIAMRKEIFNSRVIVFADILSDMDLDKILSDLNNELMKDLENISPDDIRLDLDCEEKNVKST